MNNNVKVADFGLTEDIYTKNYFRQDTSDTSVRLPLKWMALESIRLGVFSEKTDMVGRHYLCKHGLPDSFDFLVHANPMIPSLGLQ